ncbi:anti-sigma-I factor RsgI family protein [Flavonifractor sp. HCP28S3_F3]|uniref:anti-sigma-I factor RsgI family protein n=1 Tax=Flavonifractor sp. HCP28S3_F3 TaxID=3438939 RepID=UPI003F8A34BC
MNERDVERRLRTALEHAAPDDLEAVRARCGPQHSGDVIPMPKRKRPMRRAAPWLAAACLLLVIAGGVMGVRYQKASAVASLVSLDVNPSVLLEVNGAEKVLSAQPINDDAGEILDGMDLRGTDLNVAINAIVGSLLKHGYVDELANSVLVSVEDSNADRGAALEEKLTGEISQVLESASINGAILSQSFSGDDALRQKAEEYGISMGKAALIQSLVENSTHLTFESLAGLSINELNLLVNSTVVQDQPSQAGETVADQNAITSTGTASQSGYIGLEAAQSAALTHAGLDAASVTWKEADYDYEDGRMVYEMEFFANGVEYEYDVDASTGEILKMEKEGAEWNVPSGGQNTGGQGNTGGGTSGVIGREAARDAALSSAGVTQSQAYELEVDDELDDDQPHYKVEFKAGGYEYEYEIDAFTGSVLKSERDRDD